VEPDVAGAPRSAVKPLVLLVESDRRSRKLLRTALAAQDLRVVETATGAEALAQAPAHNPDLVVLAAAPSHVDAISVTASLRQWTQTPVLILSPRDEEAEKIAALDAGANDYVIAPVRTGELLARIRVWLRTTQRARATSLSSVLEVGDLLVDFGERRAAICGREVRLTPKQYKLFATLMRNAGKVLTHEQLLLSVWGPAYARETQYLRVYMGHLRQKFEENPSAPQYFLTEPGVGYRLRG
jgi:two-component system KDP operon response regulator KdpE